MHLEESSNVNSKVVLGYKFIPGFFYNNKFIFLPNLENERLIIVIIVL